MIKSLLRIVCTKKYPLIQNLNTSKLCNFNSTDSSSFDNDMNRIDESNSDSNEFDHHVNTWNDYAKYYQNQTSSSSPPQLSHIDQVTNLPKQVDISEKLTAIKPVIRIACASGYIQLNRDAFDALIQNKLKKGNALIVAQLAGIQASKQCSNLIPLCHQIQLDVCDVEFEIEEQNLRVKCKAICKTSTSKTGVEMEALTACSIALLTVYDMCKAVQKDAIIDQVKLEYKYGGKSDFNR
jgi:cyclic pyranopterin phosphate synthase